MNERLQQLRTEWEKGQQRMRALDHERLEVRDTMLRISGAVRVLEEMLEREQSGPIPVAALSTVA